MGLPPTGLYTLCWTHGLTPGVHIDISYYRDVISHYYSISFDEYETIYEISDVDDKNTV